jgi:anti-sigma factor RsiW
MNCRQIEKYLPLYASHDLSESREQLIAAHLQSCGACTEALADFQNARELMRTFTAPPFNDEVYADIRKKVWRRIESESRPTLFAAVAAWFQPRLVWTAAAAMLVTLSVVGIYVLAQKFTVRPKVIAGVPTIVLPSQSDSGKNSGRNSSKPERRTVHRQAEVPQRQQRPVRTVAPDQSIAARAYSPDVQVPKVESSSPMIGADDVDLGSGSLRMELQTRDPNIRIIWFTQGDSKPVAHSKGI